jgi:hypothetical protein
MLVEVKQVISVDKKKKADKRLYKDIFTFSTGGMRKIYLQHEQQLNTQHQSIDDSGFYKGSTNTLKAIHAKIPNIRTKVECFNRELLIQ